MWMPHSWRRSRQCWIVPLATWSTRSGGWWPGLWQGGWNLIILGVPSKPFHDMKVLFPQGARLKMCFSLIIYQAECTLWYIGILGKFSGGDDEEFKTDLRILPSSSLCFQSCIFQLFGPVLIFIHSFCFRINYIYSPFLPLSLPSSCLNFLLFLLLHIDIDKLI